MSLRIVSADQLRRYTRIKKAETEKNLSAARGSNEDQLEERRRAFMEATIDKREIASLLTRVSTAAASGAFEYEVMAFPSDFCTDRGRAINNNEGDWPNTLQGKAKQFLTLWQELGKPQGYRVKAKVVSYPEGFIGDISLLIDWS